MRILEDMRGGSADFPDVSLAILSIISFAG